MGVGLINIFTILGDMGSEDRRFMVKFLARDMTARVLLPAKEELKLLLQCVSRALATLSYSISGLSKC